MKTRLAILLWATDPATPHLCATPFSHAAAAAAMDAEVEVYFTSRAVLLLSDGVARDLYPDADRKQSIYAYMQHAAGFGAKFFACSQALAAHGVPADGLISEVSAHAGAAAFIARALDPEWGVLTY